MDEHVLSFRILNPPEFEIEGLDIAFDNSNIRDGNMVFVEVPNVGEAAAREMLVAEKVY